ncbi:PHB depolymerase family esterase [Sphingomonas sp. So64.6b]|uniref:extracellular catalytic domain type 1 short-chain-length polyhydroxyalkanoate depolymerase n=1 Tax=Sphingomonas sp. So64.6b TaxID=2997354 RepID=UPI001602D9E0|nr:PHB depolymerase family esterase [Sphingomonas sp. So64.6b]QNA82622.1 PHB depolymerase family esterase [Sphingomonas sp. So64.6b]
MRHAPGSGGPLQALTGFGSNPGDLKAWTYVPAEMPPAAPLVVVLHGCTQSAADYDLGSGWSALADRHGFALLYPEQQRSNNPNLCFNWFVPGDVRRDGGEACSIHQMVDHVVRALRLDAGRVFITGLSAGGAMTAAMLATYPEIFAGGAVIAGLPFATAKNVSEALQRMQGHGEASATELGRRVMAASPYEGPWPSLSVWHGDADRTVSPGNMEALIGQWRAVQDLPATPSSTESAGRETRRRWTDASGAVRIEAIGIAGMGHGTPIATGPDGCGVARPHILDVGISSTRRIAGFWGIAASEGVKVGVLKPAVTAPAGVIAELRATRPHGIAPIPAALSGVAKVIDDALRAAGLVR